MAGVPRRPAGDYVRRVVRRRRRPALLSFALGIVEPAQSYTDSWAQLVWGLGIWACEVTAVVTGLIAIIRHHERSRMVVLATALGLLPLTLLLSEIATGNF